MKYVPNLIPKHSKVDLDGEYNIVGTNFSSGIILFHRVLKVLLYILAILFLIISFAGFFSSFGSGLCFLLISFIFLPEGSQFIEDRIHRKFPYWVRGVITLLLFSFAGAFLPESKSDKSVGNSTEPSENLVLLRKNDSIKLVKEKSNADSLIYFKNEAEAKHKKGNLKLALRALSRALRHSTSDTSGLIYTRGQWLTESKKYNEAILDFTFLLNNKFNQSEVLYERAVCFVKLNKKGDAVKDLEQAISMGNPQAEKLYNKVNPLKKRVAYYVTRCCDGTTSNATGRGACSHHDGVCDWNEPVYEEYRDY